MIRYDLQFFGGNGAGSKSNGGAIAGAEISFNDTKTTYYFYKNGDQNYYQNGLSGSIEPTPGNISGKEFIERAKSNGAEVKTVSAKEVKKRQTDYKVERANRPDYELGYGTGNMRQYSRQARRNRLSTRAMNRK